MILDRINAEHAAKPVSRPSRTKCTGCGVRFVENAADCEGDDATICEGCDDCGAWFLPCLLEQRLADDEFTYRLYGL